MKPTLTILIAFASISNAVAEPVPANLLATYKEAAVTGLNVASPFMKCEVTTGVVTGYMTDYLKKANSAEVVVDGSQPALLFVEKDGSGFPLSTLTIQTSSDYKQVVSSQLILQRPIRVNDGTLVAPNYVTKISVEGAANCELAR